ncbi:MAG: glycoside hydrolase family 43 protein [Acidimicrobiales bacterium]
MSATAPGMHPGPPDSLATASRWRNRRRRTMVALVAALAILAAVVVAARRSPAGLPDLPVLDTARDMYDGDLGDPFVLAVPGGGYVAFGTGDWPARVPTAHSPDLITWTAGPDAMPDLPGWAAADPKNSFSWAPAVLATDGGYVLYISLREAVTGRECIGTASSPSPGGPYRDPTDHPLVCQRDLGGSIDPSLVGDDAGAPHLAWKNDGNCCGQPTGLWQQELTRDGLGVVGVAHHLLDPSQAWQGGIIEEPALVKATAGGWWLFYSGNRFDSADYATGVAYCARLEGPCQDRSPVPFPLIPSPGQHAPGGLEVFHGSDGVLWAVYDTWNRPSRNGRFYCCRSVQIARVRSL